MDKKQCIEYLKARGIEWDDTCENGWNVKFKDQLQCWQTAWLNQIVYNRTHEIMRLTGFDADGYEIRWCTSVKKRPRKRSVYAPRPPC